MTIKNKTTNVGLVLPFRQSAWKAWCSQNLWNIYKTVKAHCTECWITSLLNTEMKTAFDGFVTCFHFMSDAADQQDGRLRQSLAQREGFRLSPEVTTGQRRLWVGLLCENPHPTSLLVSKQFYWVEWGVFDVESLLEGSNASPPVHQAALKYSWWASLWMMPVSPDSNQPSSATFHLQKAVSGLCDIFRWNVMIHAYFRAERIFTFSKQSQIWDS